MTIPTTVALTEARITTVTLNPAIDQTLFIPKFLAGEVNRVEQEQSDPGGKGVNVASFLADFGYPITVTGFLGAENAEPFRKLFTQKEIRDRFVQIPGKTRVNVKIVDQIQNQVTDINFPGQSATLEDVQVLTHALTELATQCDWVVLSGSIPASVPVEIYRDLVLLLKQSGKRVVLDASEAGLRLAVTASPTIIKPNVDELSHILGERPQSQEAIATAAHQLIDRGIETVAVSMGAQGAIFVEADAAVLAIPPSVQVKSTVGAGDAMVAGIVTAKTRGYALADCARLATAFSMGALTQVGPRLPPVAAIESFTHQVSIRPINH
ncbi:1-phosphofructokinase [Oculatella sp. LEGE 06141]|uniref:1-phosphofructokinase n=1 Tax=Oculatella sp. LEGE 06141 TaxID=1828648 RepID=UPI001882ABC3|nr:1-phosphofructokinase [Oculatella sp. LEGE 06141]MBE9181113.1 1-phosphofructokinase [Oculatella sp. LEGE 06141]